LIFYFAHVPAFEKEEMMKKRVTIGTIELGGWVVD
jgi:hypothetical protein